MAWTIDNNVKRFIYKIKFLKRKIDPQQPPYLQGRAVVDLQATQNYLPIKSADNTLKLKNLNLNKIPEKDSDNILPPLGPNFWSFIT